MVHFGRWTQFHSVSRCQNKFRHTDAWRGPRPPGRADFVAENVHDIRLFETGQPVKKKTEPASGDPTVWGWSADSDCASTSEPHQPSTITHQQHLPPSWFQSLGDRGVAAPAYSLRRSTIHCRPLPSAGSFQPEEYRMSNKEVPLTKGSGLGRWSFLVRYS
jgi:hypothetical protein